MIKNDKVPSPDDINWHNFQIGFCSKLFRVIFAFLIIVIFLAISCAIIALCSIYISSHSSDCDGITIPTDTTTASTSTEVVLRCYCNANLVASFTDSTIKSVCSSYLTEIYIQEGIQYVVIISSSFTNFLFGLVTDKLINCIQPGSVSSGMASKTTIYTIFLVLNSIVIPILIYADIFGFQAANYVSFLTLISSDLSSVFNISNLTFYPNFTQVWYRNVSNVFTNFLVINTVIVWVFFIIDKYLSSKSSL